MIWDNVNRSKNKNFRTGMQWLVWIYGSWLIYLYQDLIYLYLKGLGKIGGFKEGNERWLKIEKLFRGREVGYLRVKSAKTLNTVAGINRFRIPIKAKENWIAASEQLANDKCHLFSPTEGKQATTDICNCTRPPYSLIPQLKGIHLSLVEFKYQYNLAKSPSISNNHINL
jgi:hypothetical protein